MDYSACVQSLPGPLKAATCQTRLPLLDGFLSRLCCLGPCLQLQRGYSTTHFLLECPGAVHRAGTPEMPSSITMLPGLKPCTQWVKTQTLGRMHYSRPAQGKYSFCWGLGGFKLFHHHLGNSLMFLLWMPDSGISVDDLWTSFLLSGDQLG